MKIVNVSLVGGLNRKVSVSICMGEEDAIFEADAALSYSDIFNSTSIAIGYSVVHKTLQ